MNTFCLRLSAFFKEKKFEMVQEKLLKKVVPASKDGLNPSVTC